MMSPVDILMNTALSTLPFDPLPSQLDVLGMMARFAVEGGSREVFVLNGYAGTGKTSLVGALIKAMREVRRPIVLLAPTGRAAKVAAGFSGSPASTIHRRLFRPNPADPSGNSWFIAKNECRDTLFIVDEASLISDSGGMSNSDILPKLISYVYSAPGCRLMLIGDVAQLPPVGQSESTAMNFERLRSLGLSPVGGSLDIPVRQESEGGIVHNATKVRHYLFEAPPEDMMDLDVTGYPQMRAISSQDLADALSESFAEVGEEETLIITRSNKRANEFNRAVRNMVMYAEEPLERGDRLVISKNDYFWSKKNKMKTLIANGETAEVTWVGKTEKIYGRFFTDTELRLSDGTVLNAQIMLRSLVCDGPSIPRAEMQRLHDVVMNSYDGELSLKLKGVMEDPYYNALQAKYAYCVTCHKSQGGQWKHVYIDMGGINPVEAGPDFWRWLYTAMTRATEKVILLNPTLKIN